MDERDLLDRGFYEHETVLAEASKNKRLLNYIIDYIMVIIFGMIVLAIFAIAGIYDIERDYLFVDEIVGILCYFSYYLIMESALRGVTVGKLLTKTRAVSEDGSDLTARQVLGRSLSRLVPFEQLSFLGKYSTGWHDRWSGSIVIDLRESSI